MEEPIDFAVAATLIVRDIGAQGPPLDSEYGYCHGCYPTTADGIETADMDERFTWSGLEDPDRHKSTCTWRRAKDLLMDLLIALNEGNQ